MLVSRANTTTGDQPHHDHAYRACGSSMLPGGQRPLLRVENAAAAPTRPLQCLHAEAVPAPALAPRPRPGRPGCDRVARARCLAIRRGPLQLARGGGEIFVSGWSGDGRSRPRSCDCREPLRHSAGNSSTLGCCYSALRECLRRALKPDWRASRPLSDWLVTTSGVPSGSTTGPLGLRQAQAGGNGLRGGRRGFGASSCTSCFDRSRHPPPAITTCPGGHGSPAPYRFVRRSATPAPHAPCPPNGCNRPLTPATGSHQGPPAHGSSPLPYGLAALWLAPHG